MVEIDRAVVDALEANEQAPEARTDVLARRNGKKSATAFRTISEVSSVLDVPQHVLRFWETKFTAIKPMKRGGGRRYYRPEDINLLRGIRELLYSDGYTIKGVQKLLREKGIRILTTRAEQTVPAPTEKPGRTDADPASEKAATSVKDPAVSPRDLNGKASEETQARAELQVILSQLEEARDLLAVAMKVEPDH